MPRLWLRHLGVEARGIIAAHPEFAAAQILAEINTFNWRRSQIDPNAAVTLLLELEMIKGKGFVPRQE